MSRRKSRFQRERQSRNAGNDLGAPKRRKVRGRAKSAENTATLSATAAADLESLPVDAVLAASVTLPTTPVVDQGIQDHCSAYAVAAAMESKLMVGGGDGSELIPGLTLWNACEIADIGEMVKTAMAGVQGTTRVWKAQRGVVAGSSPDVTRANMKRYLDAGSPLVMRIRLPHDFLSYTHSGIYEPGSWSNLYHAVCVIGYGTIGNRNYWLVKNSNGPGWGTSGIGRFAWGDPVMHVEEFVLAITGVQ
jgi:hypothetical protein